MLEQTSSFNDWNHLPFYIEEALFVNPFKPSGQWCQTVMPTFQSVQAFQG